MRPVLVLLALAVLSNCRDDETVAAYGGADAVWELQELDGKSFPPGSTLTFPEPGRIAGTGPCNTFFGEQTAPYPWFKVEKLASTKRACPELDQEQEFFDALSGMTLSEVAGDTLILSNDAGRELLFRAKE